MDIFRSQPYTLEGEGGGLQPRAGMPIHGTGTSRRRRKKDTFVIGTDYASADQQGDFHYYFKCINLTFFSCVMMTQSTENAEINEMKHVYIYHAMDLKRPQINCYGHLVKQTNTHKYSKKILV